MIKRFFTLALIFSIFVFIQSPVWAAVKDAGKIEMQSNQEKSAKLYLLDNNIQSFLQQDNTFQSVRRERGREEGTGQVSGLWIVSIFIMGLGQILMGEILGGLSFYLWDILILVLGAVIVAASGNSPSVLSITTYIVAISWLVIYIWNIVDAYNVAVRKANEEAMSIEERLALIEKMRDFSEKIVVKNDSLTFQFNF